MYIPCTYHTMYIRVYTFAEMYIHVCACLCFSNIVHTMSGSCCTIAWYVYGTYMVQTCLYTFMPGGQDSWARCPVQGPLASDAPLAHFQVTLPRSQRDDNRSARCASATVLQASQVGVLCPASESLVGVTVTVLGNAAVLASSQAGG
jgi:hypothetical protein